MPGTDSDSLGSGGRHAGEADGRTVRQRARMPIRAAGFMDANSGLVSPTEGLITQYVSGMADRDRLIYSKSVKRWSPGTGAAGQDAIGLGMARGSRQGDPVRCPRRRSRWSSSRASCPT